MGNLCTIKCDEIGCDWTTSVEFAEIPSWYGKKCPKCGQVKIIDHESLKNWHTINNAQGKSTELELIKAEIGILEVKHGDVIVVKIKEQINRPQRDYIYQMFENNFSNNHIVILDNGTDIVLMRHENTDFNYIATTKTFTEEQKESLRKLWEDSHKGLGGEINIIEGAENDGL